MARISKAGTALIIVNLDRLLRLTLSDNGLLCLRRLDHQRRHIGVAAGVLLHAGCDDNSTRDIQVFFIHNLSDV